jgi:hypothetical protein
MKKCLGCGETVKEYNKLYCSHKCGVNHRTKKRIRVDENFRLSRNEYFKKWYQKNKERQFNNIKRYYKNHKKKCIVRIGVYRNHRDKIYEMFEHKCCKCNAIENLEIHHLDHSTKRDWRHVKEQLDNVLLLCRDCHRKEHRLSMDD